MKHFTLPILFFLSSTLTAMAQCPSGVAASVPGGPVCEGDSAQIVTSLLGGCSSYTVSTIASAPVTGAGITVALGDNQVSNALPIGFTFNFFCQNYTQFYISSNGFITFNPASSHGCCSGQFIPNMNAPNNLIAAAWEDYNPAAGGTITYFTTGTAPNRMLVVHFNQVPHAGGGGGALNAQIVLYETTNVIEIHTTSQVSDGGLHTMGIENATGTVAVAAPGRNAANWTTNSDGKRFTPGPVPSGNFMYSWNPSTGLSNATSPNPQAAPLQTTTYVLTVTDVSCPQVSDTVIVVVDTTNISVSIVTPDTAICSGSVPITTSGNGIAAYAWSPAAGLSCTTCANPVSTPTSTITYVVNVATQIGKCTASDTINIYVSNLKQFNISATKDSICLGDSVLLNILTNFTDDFDPGIDLPLWDSILNGTASTNCGSVTGNALYFNGAGSRWATTIPLNTSSGGVVSFRLKIGTGTAPCENADAGENVLLEYSINGGGSWTNINTYNADSFTNFTLITENIPAPAQTPSTMFRWIQPLNSGIGFDNWAIDDVSISNSPNPAITFSWAPSAGLNSTTLANPTAMPSVTTTYTVTISDTVCTVTDTITIYVDTAAISVSVLTADTFICVGGNVSITTSATGAGSYLWSPAAGLNCVTCANPVASPTVTTSYVVTAFTPLGACYATDTIKVSVSSLTQITPSASPNPACGPNSQTQLNVAISGVPPFGYCTPTFSSLCSSGDFIDNFSFNTISNLLTGCNNNPNNYIHYSSMSTTVMPGGTYNMSMQSGASWAQGFGVWIDYNQDGDFGDAGEFVYSSPTFATTPFNTTITIPMSALPGTTRLRVICTWNATVTSGQFCNPSFTFGECEDYNILISGPQSNLTYNWAPSANLSNATIANPVATQSSNTTYTVTVTDTAAGCSLTGVVTVTVNPLPAANISPASTTICFGQNTTLSASGGVSYSWLPGGQTSQSIIVSAQNNYSVIVTDGAGCTAVATSSVTVNPSPVVSITGNTTICAGQNTTLTANGGTSHSWLPGGQTTSSITVSPAATTSYTVIASNSFGCTGTSMVTVSVTQLPVAGFTSTVNGSTVSFTNTSQNSTSWNWNFGDAGTSTAQHPVHTYATPGSYTVTLIASNACGSDTFTTVITVTGIWEYVYNSGWQVFPNPASQEITIDIQRAFGKGAVFRMVNALGEEILRREIPASGKSSEFKIDISSAAPGVYMLLLDLPEATFTRQLSVVK